MKEWGEIIKFPILKFFLFAVIQSLVQILWYFTDLRGSDSGARWNPVDK